MKKRVCFWCLLLAIQCVWKPIWAQNFALNAESFKPYITAFNKSDDELYKQLIPNENTWAFLSQNIPLFECPDKQLEQMYYFRWWTYRKHLKQTPAGYIITEFLPDVNWAGKYNSINCPAGHHFYEGRWLHDTTYLKQYARFWFRGGASPRSYSSWAADAISAFARVHPDTTFLTDLLPDLRNDFHEWEKMRLDSTGLFWQTDNRDGMEISIAGLIGQKNQGYRATINSYMYGNAKAIATIAQMANNQAVVAEYTQRAAVIRRQILTKLWDDKAKFFKVIPRGTGTLTRADVRELHGFTPWYFSIPDEKQAIAWAQLTDEQGFWAPYGPTTAEQRHPGFRVAYEGHECQWNGPSWPFSTAITLTSLANLLNDYKQNIMTKRDYWNLLTTYSRSQQRILPDGERVPWIDENLNPYTGDWISRTRLSTMENGSWSTKKGGRERGKDYNHSSFCDHIISGLVGIRPQHGHQLVINPLLPDNTWDYFCLDNVAYHGKTITVLYDKTGKKYGKGSGLRVFVNGVEKAFAPALQRVSFSI
ncbi:MGH1-like glycoside hydrolase domain-containing protein [Spirosoma panaciterrae]|uniref:MGH1-like glycoside hydrolase domain-containing protein n=1 Tax=Spirosoma panaciterrae TaxID=496058 RepID=UPI000373FDF9|nr:glycosyl hydrolase family 65 protein [Spirosoma panaciterrae]